jgi:hypothetical protein
MPLIIPSPQTFKSALEWLSFGLDASRRLRDAIRSSAAPFKNDEFVRIYCQHLERCISLTRQLGEATVEEAARIQLDTIATLVKAYAGRPNARTNANYMIPRAVRNVPPESIYFTGGRDLDSFSSVLQLVMWAEQSKGLPEPRRFALPVEHGSGTYANDLLFGAPSAYVNNSVEIVSDTLQAYRTVQKNDHVRTAVQQYFEDNKPRVRSFVSLPLQCPAGYDKADRLIAVVNVQSSERAMLGYSTVNRARLQIAFSPFLQILSYFVAEMHSSEILTRPNEVPFLAVASKT